MPVSLYPFLKRGKIMGKYIKLIAGLFLLLSAVIGGFNIFSGGMERVGMEIVRNGTNTIGYVEKRVKHTVAAKLGRIPAGGAYYMMHYRFKTKEGKLYGDLIKVSKKQAYALKDGQELNIRYMKGQPNINSVMGIETYMTETQAREVPWSAVVAGLAIFILGGLWLVWSGWRAIGWSFPSFSPSFGKKDSYELDRAALLNRDLKPGGGNRPMFGGRR